MSCSGLFLTSALLVSFLASCNLQTQQNTAGPQLATAAETSAVAPSLSASSAPALTSTSSVSPTPAATSTSTLTPTPAIPQFTLNENAFCRKGADVSFPDVTGIVKGTTVDILGVSEDGYWYFVFLAQYKAKCWVAAPTGQVSGDLAGVPTMVSPDTPTPTK